MLVLWPVSDRCKPGLVSKAVLSRAQNMVLSSWKPFTRSLDGYTATSVGSDGQFLI